MNTVRKYPRLYKDLIFISSMCKWNLGRKCYHITFHNTQVKNCSDCSRNYLLASYIAKELKVCFNSSEKVRDSDGGYLKKNI